MIKLEARGNNESRVKVNIAGSASIKRSTYYPDYDLFETTKNKAPTIILNRFRSVFN